MTMCFKLASIVVFVSYAYGIIKISMNSQKNIIYSLVSTFTNFDHIVEN